MKIAVAMSGGVDSSVTAALLQQEGHEVIGVTMRLFEPCNTGAGSAAFDAAVVARQLGIEHHLVDFEPEFKKLIIDDFINEYRSGHTPNPCVRCNRFIKFGLLLEAARQHGAQQLATGHYVRKTVDADGTCHLRVAKNFRKDQSYFLYTLTQQVLSQTLFPLGEIQSKDEVRRLAQQFTLPVAEKGDSQEVCFIPNDDYIGYLERQGIAAQQGDILHSSGKKVGVHNGIHRYTIGQRRGLGIAWSEPLYVLRLDAGKNQVIVAEEASMKTGGLQTGEFNWLQKPPGRTFASTCKIRYRHHPVGCVVECLDDGRCMITFDESQKSVTPGQSVVLYHQDDVLGGGIITNAL